MKKTWFLFLCLIFLLGDVFMKYYTVNYIDKMSWAYPFFPYGGIGIFNDFFGINFSLNYVANKGSAFGLFSAYSSFLFYLRIAIVVILTLYLVTYGRKKKVFFPLMLILTGAIGNIFDTFIYGHVVDMFHFTFFEYSYPVFNIADSLICIAIIWLLLFSSEKKTKEKDESRNSSDRK